MWVQMVSSLLGVWLMAAPAVLGYGDPARTNDRIVGPLSASFAFIAIWEVTRGLRWAGLPLGAWLLVAPWVLGNYASTPTLNSMVVGLLLIALSLVRGNIGQSFGGGWSALLPGREPRAGDPAE
jgi:hypothetical protein